MGKKHDAVEDLTDRVEVLEEAVFPCAGNPAESVGIVDYSLGVDAVILRKNLEITSLRTERDYWRRTALELMRQCQRLWNN